MDRLTTYRCPSSESMMTATSSATDVAEAPAAPIPPCRITRVALIYQDQVRINVANSVNSSECLQFAREVILSRGDLLYYPKVLMPPPKASFKKSNLAVVQLFDCTNHEGGSCHRSAILLFAKIALLARFMKVKSFVVKLQIWHQLARGS